MVLLLAVAAFAAPMFAVPDGIASGDAFRDNDWLNCRSFDVLSRLALLEHGQFPLRSHLVGGGFPTIAHPSDGSWAPTILAVLLFGDVIGAKVNLLLLLLAGAWGVFGLCRHWLALPAGPSLLAALLFAFSGWAPSMLLVGFYHQAFYLLVPPILLLLLTAKERPVRFLWAGLLLCFVLQQGGNAFPTVCHFLGVVCWLIAAGQSAAKGGWVRWLQPLGLLVALSASFGFARGSGIPFVALVGLALCGVWIWRSRHLRGHLRALKPWAGRLALVVLIAMGLGAGKVAGLSLLSAEGTYNRGLVEMRYWFPDQAPEPYWIERFYETPQILLTGLASRVPGEGSYADDLGPGGENTSYEYAYLGLTWGFLLLALTGAITGRPRAATALLSLCAALYAAICVGWAVPPDVHFLMVWGLPWLGEFGQPLKYYNFYMLLPLVLLCGLGARRLMDGAPPGVARIAVHVALFGLLAVPFAQNRTALGELFALPVDVPERQEGFHQVAMIGEPSWIEEGPGAIREKSADQRLRELCRPDSATEYHNAPGGVGVVDWYGTVVMPEYAVPRRYVTPEGTAHDNPAYRGEAWIVEGEGEIQTATVRPNDVQLQVRLLSPALVVVNQNWLRGFRASHGELVRHEGLLAVRLPQQGEYDLRLVYRPPLLLAGLALSALSLVAWIAAVVALRRRGRGDAHGEAG